MIFEGPQGRAESSICTRSNMSSLTALFKRLKSQFARGDSIAWCFCRDHASRFLPAQRRATIPRDLEQQQCAQVVPSVER